MLKRTIRLTSDSEITKQLEVILSDVNSSKLTEEIKSYLSEQLKDLFLLYSRQQTLKASINANRILEGDGYKIVVNVCFGRPTLMARIKQLLGLH